MMSVHCEEVVAGVGIYSGLGSCAIVVVEEEVARCDLCTSSDPRLSHDLELMITRLSPHCGEVWSCFS